MADHFRCGAREDRKIGGWTFQVHDSYHLSRYMEQLRMSMTFYPPDNESVLAKQRIGKSWGYHQQLRASYPKGFVMFWYELLLFFAFIIQNCEIQHADPYLIIPPFSGKRLLSRGHIILDCFLSGTDDFHGFSWVSHSDFKPKNGIWGTYNMVSYLFTNSSLELVELHAQV